jgi:thioredoxin reductase (NADPH)
MSEVDYDLVIIGGGPAGLTAGLYAARSRLNVVLLEKAALGGQVIISDWVENYPGFPEGLNGFELMQRMADQARRFGLTIETNEVVSLDLTNPEKKIHLNDNTITAHTIILATGASPKKLGIPGEDLFSGKGVSFCATCDGPFYKDRVVAAVGGGDTAVKESLYLTKFVKKVYLIHRRDELRATKILQERAFENDKVEIIWDSVVTSINGGLTDVENLTLKNVKTDEVQTLPVDGCFIWVGTEPNTHFLENALDVNPTGFVNVDLSMETSVPGVYAAGDIRNPLCRQIVTAVGDAATAVYSAEHYLEKVAR